MSTTTCSKGGHALRNEEIKILATNTVGTAVLVDVQYLNAIINPYNNCFHCD